MSEQHLEKLQQIPALLDAYGALLTEKQRQALSLCYEEDCTLAEIAALHGSSRQAAHDLVERGESQLRDYEAALHLVQREQQREASLARLREQLAASELSPALRRQIEEILCHL